MTAELTPQQYVRALVERVDHEGVRVGLLIAIDQAVSGGPHAAFHAGRMLGELDQVVLKLEPRSLRERASHAWGAVYQFAKEQTAP